jgi:hypothetical protein
MSIHDQRAWFRPTLMHFSDDVTLADHQTLEQVWFPGMHGDVGGQEVAPHDNLISCQSLRWMMERAAQQGLKFNPIHCKGDHIRFIFNDSYTGSMIYKLMPREDRVIEKDELTQDYRLTQLSEQGQFSKYLTEEQLQMYQSKTLQNFYQNIIEQEHYRKGFIVE